jgi:hypothetical protein
MAIVVVEIQESVAVVVQTVSTGFGRGLSSLGRDVSAAVVAVAVALGLSVSVIVQFSRPQQTIAVIVLAVTDLSVTGKVRRVIIVAVAVALGPSVLSDLYAGSVVESWRRAWSVPGTRIRRRPLLEQGDQGVPP